MFDIQKATVSKRISAFLADLVAFFILVIGVSTIVSGIVGYDAESAKFEEIVYDYEQEYIYDPFNEIYGTESKQYSREEIDNIISEDQDTYLEWYNSQVAAANEKLRADEEAIATYEKVVLLSILNITVSVLVSYIVLEIAVPLLFKNGQTIGKKVFGIALMRIDGVKISPLQLVVRTILGKYTVETMIPLLLIMSIFFSLISPDLVLFGLAIIGALVIAECVLFFKSGMTDFIHDKMALTICVDMQSQLIFENEEALVEYKRTHPTTSGDGKPLSPVAESLFSVYSNMGRAEKVELDANPQNDGNYSEIQLGNIDVDSADIFAEKEAEYRKRIETEQSSASAAFPEEESLPDAIFENTDESEPEAEEAESEDPVEENLAEEAETEPKKEISEE